MMSKGQNNQNEEKVNAEQSDDMRDDKDHGNTESSQENSESGADTYENINTENGEGSVRKRRKMM